MTSEAKAVPLEAVIARLGLDWRIGDKVPCIYHPENTPSMHLYHDGFYCFSCGKHGDGIDLVKHTEGLEHAEAVKWLLSTQATTKRNLAPSTFATRPNKADPEAYKAFLGMLSPAGALAYLQTRGIQETGGLAVAYKDTQARLLDRFPEDRLLRAGLFSLSREGRPYFTFAFHRLIIPLHSPRGELVCLQGRDIDGEARSKYRMPPGIAPGLYGRLDQIPAGETIHLCEGALDALSARALGLSNPVGLPGVHAFKNLRELFGKYRVISCGDGDQAGRALAHRLAKDLAPATVRRAVIKGDLNEALLNRYPLRAKWGDRYRLEEDGAFFEGGPVYTRPELQIIAHASPELKRAIHAVKKTFRGTICNT